MRIGLAMAALMLPLCGCEVAPAPPGYGYYPGAGYADAAYAGDFSYPGYDYNDGSPSLFVGGVSMPLVFYGGSWGYWDGARRWHRAPPQVERHLMFRNPGGVGYRPYAGGTYVRPDFPRSGFVPGDVRPGWRPNAEFRPPPSAFNPGSSGGFHPGGGSPGFRPNPVPGPVGGFHPGGPSPGGFHPSPPPSAAPANVPRFGPHAIPINPSGRSGDGRHRDDHR